MKKLICALIGAAALVASATTYIQTSSTGTAPWRPVKDSVSQAHLADSARHAPPSAYADSSRASGLADSAKRAGWAPLDTGRVRGIVGDTATALRTGMGAYIPLAGSDAIDGNLSSTAGNSLGTLEKPWGLSFFRKLSVDSLGVRRFYVESNGLLSWENGTQGPAIYCDWSDIYRPLHFANAPVDFDAYWIKAPQFIVRGGTAKGFLKADGSVDSSGVFAGVTDSSRASRISDSAKALAHYATLAQDTAIAKKVASDTATVLRTGIASAITTSEAYATARISDSLTANARAWTTLMAAKSSIHDTATALRTYIGSASTTGNAATATKLSTARTISMTGDGTWSTSFDGSANATGALTLPTLLTAGSAGSATAVPTLTWDAKGRLTAAGSAAISIPHMQISDWAASVSSVYLPLAGGTMSGNLLGGTLYNIGATSNWWGSIYATTIYESNVALSSKYLGINGTASNASALGGVAADYFVQGSNASRTTQLTASGTSQSQLFKSGFYDSQYWTDINSNWIHMIHCAYSNDAGTTNGWSFDIAANFAGYTNNGEHYYVRTVADGTSLNWRELIHSANVGSYAIPLTGSSAITGSLNPIGSTYSVGSSNAPWGEIHAYAIAAHTVFYGNRLESTGNTLSLVGGTSVAINIGNSNLLNISNSSTAIYNPLTVSGLITANGGLDLAKNLQSSIYTITPADQGKMVISNSTLNLPSFSAGTNVGFWCLVNWHVGGGTATFGPTTSGTTWILRGQYIYVNTSMPFTGIVSWDGYNWYAN